MLKIDIIKRDMLYMINELDLEFPEAPITNNTIEDVSSEIGESEDPWGLFDKFGLKTYSTEEQLLESKADEENFRNAVGDVLADKFYAAKARLKIPYNDVYYWIKQGKDALSDYLAQLALTKTNKEKKY